MFRQAAVITIWANPPEKEDHAFRKLLDLSMLKAVRMPALTHVAGTSEGASCFIRHPCQEEHLCSNHVMEPLHCLACLGDDNNITVPNNNKRYLTEFKKKKKKKAC
jgi:hypothetical protein